MRFWFGAITFILFLIGLSPMGQTAIIAGYFSIIGIPVLIWMLLSPSILIIMMINTLVLSVRRFSDYPFEVFCVVMSISTGASFMLGVFTRTHAFFPHFGLANEWVPRLSWWIG